MQTIKLHNGTEMPVMVVSTNYMDYPLMKEVVTAALKLGFRAFDTARDYGNEPVVGQVIKDCLKELGMKREDVFITTKIGNSQQALGNIEEQIEISLRNLHTDYVDLWLMHWPTPGHYINTWRKMEKVYKSGKVKAIGMANYHIRHFEKLFAAGIEVSPHCVQFECHPMRTANELIAYCRDKEIAIQAYSPICRMIPKIREAEVLKEISARTGKSIAQVILRWHYQRGTVPVFKSTKPKRLEENFDIWNFELTPEEIKSINTLDEDYKYHLESASCPGF